MWGDAEIDLEGVLCARVGVTWSPDLLSLSLALIERSHTFADACFLDLV